MNLGELRSEIDRIDDELVEIFKRRMEVAAKVADFKEQNSAVVNDPAREREVVSRMTQASGEELAGYTKVLFNTLFDISRSYQNRKLIKESSLSKEIERALAETPKLFPQSAVVACQGIEGAYSQLAADKLFAMPSIMYFNSWKGVFNAVDKNLCRYGILPIENSLHGSVTDVYDLMKKYHFHIARSIKLRVNHCLLAKGKTDISKIKDIYSHEQAIAQCGDFLKSHPAINVTVCENTAVAAKLVAESGRSDVAAISSKSCAELYGLQEIDCEVQDSDNNYTRFICISKKLEIYPGSNKISLMFTLPHRPGALYSLISRFSVLGINLTKLESRPIPGSDFEFTFYFDLDASVYSEDVISLLSELQSGPDTFEFLGSYSEI